MDQGLGFGVQRLEARWQTTAKLKMSPVSPNRRDQTDFVRVQGKTPAARDLSGDVSGAWAAQFRYRAQTSMHASARGWERDIFFNAGCQMDQFLHRDPPELERKGN